MIPKRQMCFGVMFIIVICSFTIGLPLLLVGCDGDGAKRCDMDFYDATITTSSIISGTCGKNNDACYKIIKYVKYYTKYNVENNCSIIEGGASLQDTTNRLSEIKDGKQIIITRDGNDCYDASNKKPLLITGIIFVSLTGLSFCIFFILARMPDE